VKIHPAERWLDRQFERVDIGRNGDTYLIRWFLVGGPMWSPKLLNRRLMLHRFLRSDWDDALHDHPWPYTSLILSGGYTEWSPNTDLGEVVAFGPNVGRWYGPGSLLRRPADWRHRVEIPDGKDCWSLVTTGKKVRSWGFHCPQGFIPWRQFVERADVGLPGCGD